MKKHFFVLRCRVVPLLLTYSLSLSLLYLHADRAAGQDADELNILQKQRADEVAVSLRSINKRYGDELKKLLNVLTQSGDLDAALQVKQILESIDSGGAIAMSYTAAEEAALREKLDGVTLQWNPWAGNPNQIVLNKDGTALWRTIEADRPVIWTVVNSHIVSISINNVNPHFTFNKTFSKFEWNDKQNIKFEGSVYPKGRAPEFKR